MNSFILFVVEGKAKFRHTKCQTHLQRHLLPFSLTTTSLNIWQTTCRICAAKIKFANKLVLNTLYKHICIKLCMKYKWGFFCNRWNKFFLKCSKYSYKDGVRATYLSTGKHSYDGGSITINHHHTISVSFVLQ